MKTTLQIENLKCGGCAARIKKGILTIDDVENVDVNLEESSVSITSTKNNLQEVKIKLSKLGYPEIGDKNTVLHKAKSFVSCAVGKIEN